MNNRVDFIRSSLLEGKSVTEIGSELGISRQRVHQLVQAKGLSVSGMRAERTRLLGEQIKELAIAEYAKGEIADLLGLSYNEVTWHQEKFDIEIKSTSSYAKDGIHCKNLSTEKVGFSPKGVQIWLCPDCGKKFVSR